MKFLVIICLLFLGPYSFGLSESPKSEELLLKESCTNKFDSIPINCRRAVVGKILHFNKSGKNFLTSGVENTECGLRTKALFKPLSVCFKNPTIGSFLLERDIPDSLKKDFLADAVQSLDSAKKKFKPGSCEHVYYSLFQNSDIKKPTDLAYGLPVVNSNIERRKPRERFSQAKSNFVDTISNFFPYTNINPSQKAQVLSWSESVNKADIEFNESPGGPAFGGGKVFCGNLIGRQSEESDMFYLSHELSHATNWVPDALKACLSHPQSYHARLNSSPPMNSNELNTFFKSFLQVSGASATTGYGTEKFQPYFAFAAFSPSLASLVNDIVERRKTIAKLRDRDKKIIQDNLPKALDAILISAPGFSSRSVAKVDDLGELELNNLKRVTRNASFISQAGSYKILETILKENPEQISEAAADYHATLAATRFIKNKYSDPAAQRTAALNILKGWPPGLLTSEVEGVLNSVSSKKTNEQRVFRIILANPEFRRLIGCEFQGETPGFCDGVNTVPSGQAPTQNERVVPGKDTR